MSQPASVETSLTNFTRSIGPLPEKTLELGAEKHTKAKKTSKNYVLVPRGEDSSHGNFGRLMSSVIFRRFQPPRVAKEMVYYLMTSMQ